MLEVEEPEKPSNKFAQDAEKAEHTFNKEFDASFEYDYTVVDEKDEPRIPPEEERKIRFVMQIIQSMATSMLCANKKIEHDATKWFDFFTNFPFLFNLRSDEIKKKKFTSFSLNGRTDGHTRLFYLFFIFVGKLTGHFSDFFLGPK